MASRAPDSLKARSLPIPKSAEIQGRLAETKVALATLAASSAAGLMSALVCTIKKDALSNADDDEKKSKQRQKRIGYFEPPPKKYSVFGSLIGALLGILISLPLGIAGGVQLFSWRILIGCWCLVVCSTVGLLFGFDLWNLWRRS